MDFIFPYSAIFSGRQTLTACSLHSSPPEEKVGLVVSSVFVPPLLLSSPSSWLPLAVFFCIDNIGFIHASWKPVRSRTYPLLAEVLFLPPPKYQICSWEEGNAVTASYGDRSHKIPFLWGALSWALIIVPSKSTLICDYKRLPYYIKSQLVDAQSSSIGLVVSCITAAIK